MITATDLTLYEITCSRCHRPDTIPAYSEDEVTRQLEVEGWRTGPEVCGTCQAEEGLSLEEIVSDYFPHPCDPGPAAWDRGGL